MSTSRFVVGVIGLVMLISLNACDQQNQESAQAEPIQIISQPLPRWLDGQVDMTPQAWLVERSLAKVDDKENEVQRAGRLLIMAAEKYGESHRMIANRSAQLEDMLQEQRINETAVNLLDWFVELPITQTPHSYSAICQYYFNLRTKGLDKLAIKDSMLRM